MFRKSFSRPQHDSSVTPADRVGARHMIHNDVAKRSNIVMGFLREQCAYYRRPSEGFKDHFRASLTKTSTIVRYMKGVDESYTRADVTYVLDKLVAEGFLVKEGAWYALRHDPREVRIIFK